ncbi:hypothetical protein UFOVP858_61 [uncultured Caudovirales phage]|uniref:Phage tail collar domain containing protein n=1 Tax=uncultured Caudovirales phage TaxID=2100421 RepID=A0A6J5P882_9CAUD|nr:hypothetical protein UFOVP858_61 [uncultured Caudovirales phage]
MASTYTSGGRLRKPDTGDLDGTWGPQAVNPNMEIIDRMVDGVGDIAITGTTHTLTTSDSPTLSDGAYRVLNVIPGSPAPSGTNTITLAPNTAPKLYGVKNGTAQSVILSQGSGGSVTVAAGKTDLVYATGAGASAAVVSAFRDIALSTPVITGGTASGLTSVSVSGTATATTFSGRGTIASGMIVIWSGSEASIPSGFVLCNGSSGTPDLRGDFVIGAGSTYAVGDTGGSNTISSVPAHTHGFSGTSSSAGSHNHTTNLGTEGNHTHDFTVSNTGAHTHSINWRNGDSSTGGGGNRQGTTFSANLPSSVGGSHSHSFSSNAGGSHNHSLTLSTAGAHTHAISGTTASTGNATVDVRPPYYALCFIMKV